jgi:hypothetical protein
VTGSHEVPVYGFERYADPPPLTIDVPRLLDEMVRGRLVAGGTWGRMLSPDIALAVDQLAADATLARDAAVRRDQPESPPRFTFPDDVWARVLYDVALAARRDPGSIERLVAALVPLYLGRVAGFVSETRELSAEDAEAVVQRQAAAFERAKPAFQAAWEALP